MSDNGIARTVGDLRNFSAFHWHGETFTLPQGATHLLSSDYCVNQAYAIGKHLALQCHVEMTAAMIKAWCEVGADEVESSSASPGVQTIDEMQRQMNGKLPPLQSVASGYTAGGSRACLPDGSPETRRKARFCSAAV